MDDVYVVACYNPDSASKIFVEGVFSTEELARAVFDTEQEYVEGRIRLIWKGELNE